MGSHNPPDPANAHVDKEITELKNDLLVNEINSLQEKLLEVRRLLVRGILYSLINVPLIHIRSSINFESTQARPDPNVLFRGESCMGAIRELAARSLTQTEQSEEPESVLKSVETRVNEILEEGGFPFVRRLG